MCADEFAVCVCVPVSNPFATVLFLMLCSSLDSEEINRWRRLLRAASSLLKRKTSEKKKVEVDKKMVCSHLTLNSKIRLMLVRLKQAFMSPCSNTDRSASWPRQTFVCNLVRNNIFKVLLLVFILYHAVFSLTLVWGAVMLSHRTSLVAISFCKLI